MTESEKIREQANYYFRLAKQNYREDRLRVILNKMAFMLREEQKKVEQVKYNTCKNKHNSIEFIEYCLGYEIYRCIECGRIIQKKPNRRHSNEF